MTKLYCKILSIFFILIISTANAEVKSNHGLDGYEVYYIDATKNANTHARIGNIFYDEKNYISALKEYEIALSLTETQRQKAVFLHNIASCLFNLGDTQKAEYYSKMSISHDCMNIAYYKLLAKTIVKQKKEETEIAKLTEDKENPYNEILVALIYLEKKDDKTARTILDDFINKYPKMIVTEDVKQLLYRINKSN